MTRPEARRPLALLAGLAAALALAAAALFLPSGIDWHQTLRPAALALLHGASPYTATPGAPYAGAPWGLWLLLPLALLPESLGRALHFSATLLAFAYAARRLGAGPWGAGLLVASPPVVHCLLNSNLDWMPVLGFVLPPQWGLFLIAVKPQIGFTVALWWLVEAWRQGGWREAVRVFAPVTAALALSLLVYGPWPLKGLEIARLSAGWNASLWPLSLPAGFGLLWASLRRRDQRYAMGAAPCLSPYVLFHAWSGALAALAANPGELFAAVVGLWILVGVQAAAW
jgi:hypothetical protein